ncbi:adaptin ear-binding coat-associated 1 [Fusarium mundagurra]|uniref:Adaptin ear-binding coat-associated 1 n=3 Tax=Fusarium TaxID=5506 RepID=A0A8H5Z0L4_9HYPO|nr:adaptin ear-binding coat-associated 1 [Fusarium mundagurra]
MELLDPATGAALPNDAIQRILFVANAVHVYNIPPLTSTKGYSASTWTAEPQRHIFTARLRVVETAYESESSTNKLKVDAVLEDASSGQLFAAAPYTAPGVVEPVLDSSRFFAVTVRDPQGRKAILGIGFEERSEAFDLSIALQEARKALGWEGEQSKPAAAKEKEEHRDYSLKDGETITVSFGGSKFGRRKQQDSSSGSGAAGGDLQSFALPPPPAGPSSSGGFSLPPPPSANAVKQQKQSAKDLGFDDGQFGEFA